MGAANYLRSLADLLLPPRCHLCGTSTAGEAEARICPHCIAGLARAVSPRCPRCGYPFPLLSGADRMCGICLSKGREFRTARQFGLHQGRLAEAVHLFKYGRRMALARPLGDLMAELPLPPTSADRYDLVVPVPLHPKRLREREFNQALLLARQVGMRLGVKLDYLSLVRSRWTAPQVGLNWEERRKNVRGAFTVARKDRIKGRIILLVDDVITSGATVEECANALNRAGAAAVDVVALARASGRPGDDVRPEQP